MMLEGLMGLGMLAAAVGRGRGLPPLLKWPGGKARLASSTIKEFPEHDTYIEPFVGGGAVYFRHPGAETMVVGDADEWSIRFFNDVRKGKLKGCKIKASRSTFDRALGKKDPCSKLAVSSLSYHGDKSSYGAASQNGKVVGATKMKRLDDYEAKLRKTHLRIGSFENTMKKFDSPTAVHYLDPPWPLDSDYSEKYGQGSGGHSKRTKAGDRRAFDPGYVMKQASKMKGYVYVVYGDHPSVRKAYAEAKKCGWKIITRKVDTNKGTGGMAKRVNLIAIKPAGKIAGCSIAVRKKKI